MPRPKNVPDGSITSYRTPSGRKRYRFVIDAPPGTPGGRRQIKREGFTKREDARAALDVLRRDLYDGLVVAPDAGSVEAFALSWLAALGAEGLEPSTVLHYNHCIRRLLPHVGALALQELDAPDLDAAYAALAARGLSARSIRATHVAAKKMLAEARRLGKVRHNVSADARPPRARAARAKAFPTWTLPELRRFLGATAGDELAAVWWVMAFTGIRRGEAVGLRWADVDLDRAVLRVARAVGRGAEGAYIKEPKSDRSSRSIELDAATVRVLRDHETRQKERRLLVGSGWHNAEGLVFVEPDGSPIRPGRLTERWRALVADHATAAGVAPIRLHDLRHSHATQLLAAGGRPDIVSKRLGHSSVAFTLSTYAHVYEGDQRAALAAMLGSGTQ